MFDHTNSQQKTIFSPFFAMICVTVVVWIYMYIRRIHFLLSRNIKPNQIRRPEELSRVSPDDVQNPSDNLKNLFEIPILFYVFVIYLFVNKQVDSIYVYGCWFYVLCRALHSFVHCTINIVLIRFYLYLFSCLCLFFMIGRAMFVHFYF